MHLTSLFLASRGGGSSFEVGFLLSMLLKFKCKMRLATHAARRPSRVVASNSSCKMFTYYIEGRPRIALTFPAPV